MATGGADAIAPLLEKLLTCEVCKEEFDSTLRLPRILPCYHSFCEVCLELLTKEGKVKCPKCQQEAAVTTKAFQTDTVRVHLMDWKKSTLGVENRACQGCSVVAKATWKCQDCNEFYCRACTDYHRRLKATKSHVLVSLSEAAESPEKLLRTQSEKCLRHPDQILVKSTQLRDQLHQSGSMQVAPHSIVEYRRRLISMSLGCRMLETCDGMERTAADLKKKVEKIENAATLQELSELMEKLRVQVQSLGVIVCQAAAVPSYLRDLPVAFPDIRLDGSHCDEGCTVSADGCSLTNQRRPSSPSQSQKKFRFMGTCGTVPLPGQTCYWQVHVKAPSDPKLILPPLCEVGVASLETLQEDREYVHFSLSISTPRTALAVMLRRLDSKVVATGPNGDRGEFSNTTLGPINPHSPVERTIGFLLEVQKEHLFILDVDGRRVISKGKVAMSQPLWPCVSIPWPACSTHVSVSVSVVSGRQLTLTPDMVSLIRSLLK